MLFVAGYSFHQTLGCSNFANNHGMPHLTTSEECIPTLDVS